MVEVTGLRNPCRQLNDFQPGLMNATLDRDADGNLIRKAGIMAVVLADGEITPGDRIEVEPPLPPHRPLRWCDRHRLHHPHPEHLAVSDIDIVFAHEIELAVAADAEHREAGRHLANRPAVLDRNPMMCAATRTCPLGSM